MNGGRNLSVTVTQEHRHERGVGARLKHHAPRRPAPAVITPTGEQMMTKILAASIAALAFATTPVFAQSSTSPSMPGSSGSGMGQSMGQSGQLTFVQAPQPNQVLASELMDANVYGSDGNSIGEISDILLDRGGQIHAVVFGVGGFLGMGEKSVAVSYNALQISQIPQGGSGSTTSAPGTTSRSSDWNSQYRITLNATRDQLRSAPDFRSQRTTTTGSLSNPSGTIAR
jgi:sporulation protein YlmC with PRC-barrel domain